MFFLGRHKKSQSVHLKVLICKFLLVCVSICVCLLTVWERVYSQVLADILGLCGCGWWLACCADNREGTAYFFCISICLCVCVCVDLFLSIDPILYRSHSVS